MPTHMLSLGQDQDDARGGFSAPIVLGGISGACLSLAGTLSAASEAGRAWIWFLLASSSFACALVLWRVGRLEAAGRVVFLTALGVTVVLAFTAPASGLDARGLMLLPVLAISANVLLRRREALFGMGAVLVALGIVRGAPASLGLSVVDFGFPLALVAVSCVASRLLAERAAVTAARALEGEQALAQANECLQAEASRREALIRELEGRNAELERFCYTVSHDLKNPLVTIGGFLGYVERNAAKGDLASLRVDIERIGSAHQKMLRLLDDLLGLSRAGRQLRPSENVPFAEIVQEACDLCAGTLTRRQANVVVAPDLPVVHADRQRIVQVVQNLIDNAAKYSDGEQPTVEIGVRQDAMRQVLFVRDNGIGIPRAYHDKIFLLFEKLSSDGEGSGVGLAVVKRIIELHGGRIWVESDGSRRGSTFCFTLPKSTEPGDQSLGGPRRRPTSRA